MTTDPPEPKARRKWHFYKWLVLLIVATFAYAQWRAYTFRSALKEAYALGWQLIYNEPYAEIRNNWKSAFKKETWLDGVTNMVVPTGETLLEHADTIQRLNPKVLSVFNAQAMRDLAALKGLTRLESLYVFDAKNLTNLDTVKTLPALNRILLSSCWDLTKVDAFKDLSSLTMISLLGCIELSNVDALKNLTALRELRLNSCTKLINVDALKNLTALVEVDLSDCTGLTNINAIQNLTALQFVFLDGCTGLTKESIEALKATHPKTMVVTDKPSTAPKPSKPDTTSEERDTDRQPENTDTPPPAPKPIKPPPTNGERIPGL